MDDNSGFHRLRHDQHREGTEQEVDVSQGTGAGPPTTGRMAHVVNSIKEGFRRLGAGRLASDGNYPRTARRWPLLATDNGRETGRNLAADGGNYVSRRVGGKVWGARRKVKGVEKEMSFEMYLSSLPKSDAVDRTVHWLFHQLHEEKEAESRDHESQREKNVGDIVTKLHTAPRHHSRLKVQHPDPDASSWQQGGESSPYETSLSYYESARGTGGRGTPPLRAEGQPRLDDLFRQLQVRREREARMKLQAQEQHRYQQQHLLISNLQLPGQLAGNKVPGILEGTRHDPVPISSQHNPFTVYQNSTYYHQCHTHQCEWGECRMKFLSSKDVLHHIQDQHLSYLQTGGRSRPIRSSQRLLMCEWRGCENNGRGYIARHKLLMHIKMAHVQSQRKKTDSHSPYWKR